MLKITKIFHFEMAHALHRYDGACANIHGHSYRLEVCVTGDPITDVLDPKCGMIMDFGDLKALVQEQVLDRVDHALVLNAATDGPLLRDLQRQYANILVVDYQPTSENLLVDFAARIRQGLPPRVRLLSIRMYETASSYAEWTAED